MAQPASTLNVPLALFCILILIVGYMLPTVVAFARGHHRR